MTASVATREPDKVSAATSWSWRRDDLVDYPASAGWTLKYVFRSSSASFNFDAVADGDSFAVARSPTDTQGIAAGSYAWAARACKGTDAFEVGRGTLVVLPSLVDGDPRSHARRVLDAIEAVIEGRASRSDMSYEIAVNGSLRRLASVPHAELVKLRLQYRAEVRSEDDEAKRAQGRGGRRRILTRFVRPR